MIVSGNDDPGSDEIVTSWPCSSALTPKEVLTSFPRKRATCSYRDPIRIGGSVIQRHEDMLRGRSTPR